MTNLNLVALIFSLVSTGQPNLGTGQDFFQIKSDNRFDWLTCSANESETLNQDFINLKTRFCPSNFQSHWQIKDWQEEIGESDFYLRHSRAVERNRRALELIRGMCGDQNVLPATGVVARWQVSEAEMLEIGPPSRQWNYKADSNRVVKSGWLANYALPQFCELVWTGRSFEFHSIRETKQITCRITGPEVLVTQTRHVLHVETISDHQVIFRCDEQKVGLGLFLAVYPGLFDQSNGARHAQFLGAPADLFVANRQDPIGQQSP